VRPVEVVRPSSVDEVVDIVDGARTRGLRASAVGAGPRLHGVGATDGIAIDLGRLTRIHDADPDRATVTVGAGITLAVLATRLAGFGLALPGPGDAGRRRVGDAVATGPRGAGPGFGGLGVHVVGVELVTADATVHRCSATEEPDLWQAGRLGLGALGAVTALSLRVVPGFAVRAVHAVTDLDGALAELDGPGGTRTAMVWDPATDVVRTTHTVPTDEDPRGNGRLARLAARAQVVPPGGAGGRHDVVDRAYRVLGAGGPERAPAVACAVASHRLGEALERLRTILGRGGPWVVGVCVAPADDVWLSPGYGRDSAHLVVAPAGRSRPGRAPTTGGQALEADEALADLGARPHWPTPHDRRAADLAALYPRWDDWHAVRTSVDPDGMWANPYLDRVLGDTVLGDTVLGDTVLGDTVLGDRVLGRPGPVTRAATGTDVRSGVRGGASGAAGTPPGP
jgi:L-gulonolactone oxidase